MSQKRTSLPIPGINQDGLSQRVYVRLKDAILNGNFALGERLPTEELAKHFQVSSMPVRDAMKLLEADGLVEIIPRRGAFVTEVSQVMVREIFQIRRFVERASVEHLENVSPSLLEQMKDTYRQMESLRTGQKYKEYPRYVQLDAQLHNLIVKIPGNMRLLQVYQELHWSIQLILVLSHSDYQRAEQTAAEHKEIIDALSARNVDRAQKAIIAHLTNAEDDLLRRLPEPAPSATN